MFILVNGLKITGVSARNSVVRETGRVLNLPWYVRLRWQEVDESPDAMNVWHSHGVRNQHCFECFLRGLLSVEA